MYQLRGLKTNDIYPMSKILKKINMKIKATEKDDEGNIVKKTQEQVGVEMVIAIAENFHMAQTEVNEFLGSMVGLSGEEFGELPIEESAEIIMKFKEIPNLANFFKLASRLMK